MTEYQELYQTLAQLVNDQINLHGEIGPSNRTIWQGLHSIPDHIWREMLVAQSKDWDYQGMWQTCAGILEHLDQYGDIYAPWCLTPHPTLERKQRRPKETIARRLIWLWLMQNRETYCAINGIDLPNRDSSRGKLTDWNTQ